MEKLLVVGAVPDFKHHLRYGGATILMQNFIEYLTTEKIDFKFAQTNKFSNLKTGGKRHFLNKIYFLFQFFQYLPWCDTIMFNLSDNGVSHVFPKLSRISKIFKKRIVLRKFGGSYKVYFDKLSRNKQVEIVAAINHCDLILLETKSAIDHMKSLTSDQVNIQWFPNVRNASTIRKDTQQFNKRLGFISQISDEKGIGDLVSIAEKLAPEYTVDVYGYIAEKKYINFDWESHNMQYHGEVSSDAVPDILKNLLLLLLTSYREGYPGIIIEALSIGLPVLTTNVGGIPEMIQDGIEGFIISPGDIDAVINKIKSLTPEKYANMCDCALRAFMEKFEAGSTNKRILKQIKAIQ